MRYVTFSHAGFVRAGVLESEGEDGCVLDLAHPAMRGILGSVSPHIPALLERGLPRISEVLAAAVVPAESRLPLAAVRLLAPLPRPRRIIAAALNYRDAIAERGMTPPAEPVLFLKSPDAVTGPGEAVRLPAGIGGVSWEAELAVVIGREMTDVAPQAALSGIAGYFIINDVSASELIRADGGKFDRGKNFPTFAPCGPFLATADEIPDPQDLPIRFTLSGETMQDSTTAQMLFGIGDLLSRLSRSHRLVCGDVIATGTPAGVAAVRKPPRWLRPGDLMVAEIAGLGRLSNPVVQEQAHA